MQLDEKARLHQKQLLGKEGWGEPDEQGFVSRLMVSEVTVQEEEQYAEYVTDIEVAHEAALIVNEAYDKAEFIVEEAVNNQNK